MKVNKCTYIYFLGLYDCLMSTVLSLHASNGSKMDQYFLLVIFFLLFWYFGLTRIFTMKLKIHSCYEEHIRPLYFFVILLFSSYFFWSVEKNLFEWKIRQKHNGRSPMHVIYLIPKAPLFGHLLCEISYSIKPIGKHIEMLPWQRGREGWRWV